MLAACACCSLPFARWLVVSTVNSLFHSLADLLWLSCAGTAAAHDCSPPGSDAEGDPSRPEVGSTGINSPQSRRPASSRASAGQDCNPGHEDDMAVGMYPTFARCSSLTVSVCLQITEFDSSVDWEQFRENHRYGFAAHRDRRAEAAGRNRLGWVPMLLPCSFSCTYIV